MMVAGFSMVLVGSTFGDDRWGTITDSTVYEVTILTDDHEDSAYDDSVKEPEISFDGSKLYFT